MHYADVMNELPPSLANSSECSTSSYALFPSSILLPNTKRHRVVQTLTCIVNPTHFLLQAQNALTRMMNVHLRPTALHTSQQTENSSTAAAKTAPNSIEERLKFLSMLPLHATPGPVFIHVRLRVRLPAHTLITCLHPCSLIRDPNGPCSPCGFQSLLSILDLCLFSVMPSPPHCMLCDRDGYMPCKVFDMVVHHAVRFLLYLGCVCVCVCVSKTKGFGVLSPVVCIYPGCKVRGRVLGCLWDLSTWRWSCAWVVVGLPGRSFPSPADPVLDHFEDHVPQPLYVI